MNARAGNKAIKDFAKVIWDLGLKITVQSKCKVVDYLDVMLNLTTGKYYPFRKPDNDPLYINAKSNHPPSTIEQIPTSTSIRILGLPHDQDKFDKSSQLQYTTMPWNPVGTTSKSIMLKTKEEKNQNGPTNIAKSFLYLIDKHFQSHTSSIKYSVETTSRSATAALQIWLL